MTESNELVSAQCEEPEPCGNSPYNAAAAGCIRAWNRAYKKARKDGESKYESEKAGKLAYLNLIPPLAGRENIRDFIACVTGALVLDILQQNEVTPLLYAAQVATGAAGREPNPRKPVAKPKAGAAPKTNAESEAA